MAKTIKAALREMSKSLRQYNTDTYQAVTVDFSSDTWNTVGTHELLTVTGLNRIMIIPEVTETPSLVGATPTTICLGHESDSDNFIGDTTVSELADGELWLDTSPTEVVFDMTSAVDKIVNGVDVGYELKVGDLSDGTVVFHCWSEQLNSTGAIVAGAGGSLT